MKAKVNSTGHTTLPMNMLADIRSLSRVSAKLCLSVERFCRMRLAVQPGSRLLLALSGGADSTALAVIFYFLAPRLRLELHALTINHGLRSEARADCDFVMSLCADLGIPCHERTADVHDLATRQGIGIEEAGRTLRYKLLEEERQRTHAHWIALGHQRSDLAEDALMRLTRGTGWPALAGMDASDPARHIVRPLLLTPPEALHELLRECRCPWQEDAENVNPAYTRNRMRMDVLPLLRRENPSLEQGLVDLWETARLDAAYWADMLAAALAQTPWLESEAGILLPRALLCGLHAAARMRLYLKVVHRLGRAGQKELGQKNASQARADTFRRLDAAWSAGRGNTRFQLPGDFEAVVRKGDICFSRKPLYCTSI